MIDILVIVANWYASMEHLADLFIKHAKVTVLYVQIRQMVQSQLRLCGDTLSQEDLEFMQYGTLKMIYMEQVHHRVCAETKNLHY